MINNKTYKLLLSIALIIVLVVSAFYVYTNNQHNIKRSILVIQSYEESFGAYPSMNNMFTNEFKRNRINTEIKTFYLDCERYLSLEEVKRIEEYLFSLKEAKQFPDIIIINDDQALYSFLKCNKELINSVPVIFFGVNYPRWEMLKEFRNVVGFWDKPDYVGTLKMIEHLLGKVRVTYMNDNTALGKLIDNELKKQITCTNIKYVTPYEEDAAEGFNNDITQGREKPDSLVIYATPLRKIKGENALLLLSGMDEERVFLLTKRDITTYKMGAYSNYPTFTTINEGLGFNQGILAGYVAPIQREVYNVVSVAAKILHGTPVTDFSIAQMEKEHIVDWEEMKKWNIDTANLPAHWEIINIPFWDRYNCIVIILTIIVFFALLLIIVLMNRTIGAEKLKKHKAQEALKWKQQVLSLALESGNIFAWKYDTDNGEVIFDKEFFEYLNIKQRKYLLSELVDVVHPDDYDNAFIILRRHIKITGEKLTFSIRAKFSGSEYTWWEFRCTPVVIDKLNQSVIIAGLCLSIQEYKEREQELIGARDLASKAELKESFLANMSHEIRTPLNAIVGFSNLLLTDDDSFTQQERSEYVSVINKNCNLLLKLINDILDIARIESGQMSFSFSDVNLKELFRDLYLTHSLLIPQNIEFIFQEPQEGIIIHTDKSRLTQVLTNFINNAVKFTKAGYIKVSYEIVEVEHSISKEICLSVEDTGKGIPKDLQKIIFERFYKQDEFVQGTGLGLAICSIIVQRLGGRISIDSQEGKGSKFTIHHPYCDCTNKSLS